jgi:hypothetical protein
MQTATVEPPEPPPPPLSGHPGLRGAAALAVLWGLAWVVFYALFPGARVLGLPLLTWSLIGVGVFSVVLSLALIPRLEEWERR